MVVYIFILLAFLAGFFCAIKAVQIGLRWQIQTEVKQEPTLNNPVAEVIAENKAEKANQYTKEVLNEWLYGK